jgi:hypothetical protein
MGVVVQTETGFQVSGAAVRKEFRECVQSEDLDNGISLDDNVFQFEWFILKLTVI